MSGVQPPRDQLKAIPSSNQVAFLFRSTPMRHAAIWLPAEGIPNAPPEGVLLLVQTPNWSKNRPLEGGPDSRHPLEG